MGCKTDLPSNEPETERSRVVTVTGTECNTDRGYPHSVTIYNKLESATCQFRNKSYNVENSKMATGCSVDLGTDVDKDQTESTGGLNTPEMNTRLSQENILRLNGNNEVTSNQSESETSKEGKNMGTENVEKTQNTNIQTVSTPGEVQPAGPNPGATGASSSTSSDDTVLVKILSDLDELKGRLETATDIPEILLDVTLNCLKPTTIDYISYHLDPESDVMSPEGRLKDYRGLAELIGLEPIFIKYISRSSYMLKTKEVISKWLTLEEEPLPILKNLRAFLIAIDRPDVLEDMSVKMALDAVTWKKTQIEARTKRQVQTEDNSWQLTRHDVVSGSPTNYTCCLVYADEDEGMVQIFTKLYKTVYPKALFFLPQFDLKQGKFILDTTAQVIEERCGGKVIFFLSEYFFASPVCRFTVNFCKDMDALVSGKKTMYTACLLYADEDELMAELITKLYKDAFKDSLFFLPQFDLKQGKYELDTTARVIDERCDKKVIFLLSEYFYASTICQFAVNYAAAHGTGNGNLIPFHLTRNVTTVPNVLKGIAGIRWFRKATRQHTWQILAECLLAEKIKDKELLKDIKERIEKMVSKDSDYYLQDPPYDDDIEPPGDPIEVVEPAGSSSMPSSADIEMQKQKIAEEMQKKKDKDSKSKWSLIKQIKKAIFEKILPQSVGSNHSRSKTPSSSSSTPSSALVKSSSSSSSSTAAAATAAASSPSASSAKAPAKTGMVNDCNKNTRTEDSIANTDSSAETDENELGACGGHEDISTQNDLNSNSEPKPSEDNDRDELNICESESMGLCAKTKNLSAEDKISKSAQSNADGVMSNDMHSIYNSDNKCTKTSNISLKPGGSYEMKVIKTNFDNCENDSLINKDDRDNDNRTKAKPDDMTGDLNETDALMADYTEA